MWWNTGWQKYRQKYSHQTINYWCIIYWTSHNYIPGRILVSNTFVDLLPYYINFPTPVFTIYNITPEESCTHYIVVFCRSFKLLTTCWSLKSISDKFLECIIICDRACKNRPCERKLHQVIFLLISFIPNALSHFRKLQKKAH